MITLTILLIITLLCILVGCLMGLFSLVGVIASLIAGVLVGALELTRNEQVACSNQVSSSKAHGTRERAALHHHSSNCTA